MPMRLKVGLNRKVGQPDFGSLGASCDVELELDGALLFADPDALQAKIRTAYAACERAITEELTRQSSRETPPSTNGNGSANVHAPSSVQNSANGSARNGASHNDGTPRKATASQVRALYAIANRAGVELLTVIHDRFRVYKAEHLTVTQASQLIDELKGTSAGSTNGTGGRR